MINGEKFFEYRRRPISSEVTHVIVYASSPLKRIIGVVEVSQIHSDKPARTWTQTSQGAGITKKEFLSYFAGSMVAYAIEINPNATIKLNHDVKPKDIDANFRVPQSFMYVDHSFLYSVMRQGL